LGDAACSLSLSHTMIVTIRLNERVDPQTALYIMLKMMATVDKNNRIMFIDTEAYHDSSGTIFQAETYCKMNNSKLLDIVGNKYLKATASKSRNIKATPDRNLLFWNYKPDWYTDATWSSIFTPFSAKGLEHRELPSNMSLGTYGLYEDGVDIFG
jgi:hypothetical protein